METRNRISPFCFPDGTLKPIAGGDDTPNTLKEVTEALDAKSATLAKAFEEAGDEMDMAKVTVLGDDFTGTDEEKSAAKAKAIKALNDELTHLGKKRDELRGYDDMRRQAQSIRDDLNAPNRPSFAKGGPGDSQIVIPDFGKAFVESEAYKALINERGQRNSLTKGPVADLDIEVKTLFETSAGYAPEALRRPGFVPEATRPIEAIDVFPMFPTDQSSIVYMEETTFTNNAAETAEGGTYPEAALAFTEQSSAVRKIPVFIPVTDEQLEDVSFIGAYLDQRLRFMIRQRLDGQLLTGDGVAPNLTGLENVGSIQTQAKGADPVPDAIYKAMTKVRVTGRANPDTVFLHANDWQGIRLLRTSDGIYIWGSPADAGPERIWGLPVVQTSSQTENTGLVVDVAGYTYIATRRGIEVEVSNSHDDYFVKGKQAVRASMRVAFVVTRPAAICSVTGI